jgi:hypothetical protein
MGRRSVFVFSFVLVASIVTQANAEDFAIQGVGTSTCTKFANIYKSDAQFAENLYFTRTQGYLSGWNAAQIDAKKPTLNLALLDIKSQEASLRRYCDQHPFGDYLDAVFNLMLELKSKYCGRQRRSFSMSRMQSFPANI